MDSSVVIMDTLTIEHCELQRSALSLLQSDDEGDDEVFYEVGISIQN